MRAVRKEQKSGTVERGERKVKARGWNARGNNNPGGTMNRES